MNRNAFAFNGNVGAGSNQSQINWAGAQAGMAQGALVTLAGFNAGVQTTIRSRSRPASR